MSVPGASPNTLADADNAVLLIQLSGENLSGGSAIGLLIRANDLTIGTDVTGTQQEVGR